MTPPYPPPMALAQLSFMACRLPLLKNYILTLKVQKKVDEEKKIEKKRKKKNKFKSFTCSQDMFEVAGEERGVAKGEHLGNVVTLDTSQVYSGF